MCRKDVREGRCERDISGFRWEISGNRGSASKTRGGYRIYKVFLYYKGDCVKRFYATIDTLDYKE